MFLNQLRLSLFKACISVTAFFCLESQLLAAQGYRLPFPEGKLVNVIQSCVDSIEANCAHSDIPQIKYAIDFACNIGEPIVSIQDGVVDRIGFDADGYGNYIKIKHSDGKYSLYAHLKEASSLSSGNLVSQGQTVGKCGNTGLVKGPHLHLELRPTSAYSTIPIYFDECINNSKCTDGQVSYPNSYLSTNVVTSPGTLQPKPIGLGCTTTPLKESEKSRECVPIEEGQIMWQKSPLFEERITSGGLIISNVLITSKSSPLFPGNRIAAVINDGSDASGLSRRETPGGNLIGYQDIPWGMTGTYAGGFSFAPVNGIRHNWLKINWDNGKSGYSSETYLNYVHTFYKLEKHNVFPIIDGDLPIENPENFSPISPAVPEPSLILGWFPIVIAGAIARLKKKN